MTADHNVMLAKTRGLLGPMDYTPGGFNNVLPSEFAPRNTLPFVQTTRAHGLALYVAFASLSNSPDVYAASPQGFESIRSVPPPPGMNPLPWREVGSYIAAAGRKGRRWHVGVLNDSETRGIRLPLDQPGKAFHMTLWRDGAAPRDIVKKNVRSRRLWRSILPRQVARPCCSTLMVTAHMRFERALAACAEVDGSRCGPRQLSPVPRQLVLNSDEQT